MRRARWIVPIAALGLLGAVGGGCGLGFDRERRVEARQASTPAPPAARTAIHALARIEPADGLIAVGSRPGVRIERILVREGDDVAADQPLAVLEGHRQAQVQLELAEAQKRAALEQRARRREALAVDRARTDQIQKVRLQMLGDIFRTLAVQANDLDKLIKDLEEGKLPEPVRSAPPTAAVPRTAPTAAALVPTTLSPKERSDLKVALSQLRVETYQAYLAQEQAKADQDALPGQRAVEDRQLADGGADDEVLDRQIALARANLDAATIRAPAAGRVVEILAHPGEIGAGHPPLLYLADLARMTAVAEVDQADVPALQLDDPAEVLIAGKPVAGKVAKISRIVGGNQLVSLDPRAPRDLRVVKVVIALEAAEPAARSIQMQVEAVIRPAARAASR